MRKEYRKAVREVFSRRLRRMAPDLELVKVESPLLFGGETVFQWAPGGGFIGWVLLVPDSKRQAFTVEVGWSNVGEFPEFGMRPSVMLGPDEPAPVDVPAGFVRLGGLASGTDVWWNLPDPALLEPADLTALQASLEPIDLDAATRDAEAPVKAALEMLRGHGLSFLQEAAKRAGVQASTADRLTPPRDT